MAEWWEDESGWGETADPNAVGGELPDWALDPGWGAGATRAEQQFRLDPELTPEALEALPEMTHSSRMIEGFETPGGEQGTGFIDTVQGMGRRMGTELSQAWLQMTTTDPVELGMILEEQFPDLIEVRTSPPTEENPMGVLVARNKATGYEAVINKPGLSGMDVLQTIGVIGQYAPATRATALAPTLGRRALAGGLSAGLTEDIAQRYQSEMGGEYDPEDVAMATAFGGAGEYLGAGLVAGAGRLRQYLRPVDEIDAIPKNIREAMRYAEQMGDDVQVTTSDALAERLTPAMKIFLRIAERIPVFGTAGQRRAQVAARADAMQNVARRFDIELETDLGEEIAETWLERMRKQRWFGRNEKYAEPGAASYDMMERAFAKEAEEAIDMTMRRRLRQMGGAADFEEVADIVEMTFNRGRGSTAGELMRKLTPEGQRAYQREFVRRGLTEAGFEEGVQQTIPDPKKFLNFLNRNREMVTEMFDGADRELLDGVREYIRITSDAAGFAEGAGMTAAMAAGGGALFFLDLITGAISGATTGLTARGVQSEAMRNLLLKLVHVKGNRELEKQVVDQLRPLAYGVATQWMQSTGDMPSLFIGEGGGQSAMEAGASTGQALQQLAAAAGQQIGRIPAAFLSSDVPEEEPVQ